MQKHRESIAQQTDRNNLEKMYLSYDNMNVSHEPFYNHKRRILGLLNIILQKNKNILNMNSTKKMNMTNLF